jgi:hypothetical protein
MVIDGGRDKVRVPEGLPLNDLKKKIDNLIKEEEDKLTLDELKKEKEQIKKEDRKEILYRYYGIIKLDRIVSIEEILDLEEDSWRY